MSDNLQRQLRRWLNRIISNAASFLLALTLALIVWFVAVQQQNPFEQGEVGSIIVIPSNIPSGLVFFGGQNESVRVEVRAPKRTFSVLQSDSFLAQVDLSELKAGETEVPVQVSHPDPDVKIVDVRPTEITVRLEELLSKTLTVQVQVMDTAPFGYESNTPIITPTTVTITGAAPYVDDVRSAVVAVFLRDARQTVQREQAVSLRNAEGNPTRFVEVVPGTISVTVPIVQRAGFADVAVRVRWEGDVAAGYRIGNVAVDPEILTVFGAPDAIAELPGYVETVPVVIENAQADVVERLPLILPESVSAFGVQSVLVRVTITPIEDSRTVERTPVIQGLTPGWTVQVSPPMLEVIIAGPLARLDVLRTEDVRVVIDVANLGTGTHTVTPLVILPEDIRQESLVPNAVEVEIIAPTPTATPTWTVTPTTTPTATLTETPTPETLSEDYEVQDAIAAPLATLIPDSTITPTASPTEPASGGDRPVR